MQLPPAISVHPSTPLKTALTLAQEREYSQLTVTSAITRKLLGYLDIAKALEELDARQGDAADDDLTVKDVYLRFDRRPGVQYQVITPDSDLADLAQFLQEHEFAVVTDASRKFVLGIATRQDLDDFLTRRG